MADVWFIWFVLISIIVIVALIYLYAWLIIFPRLVNDRIDMIMGIQKENKKEVNE